MSDDNEERLRRVLKHTAAELHRTRERLRAEESRSRQPIAIVGMGCRYPGGVHDPDLLWDLLAEERNITSEFPTDRGWATDGSLAHLRAGFIDDAAGFDPGFFGIVPSEAVALSPLHRIALETSWEALERASIDPLSLRGEHVGVFVGMLGHVDYVSQSTEIPLGAEPFVDTGNASAAVSGRIAYILGVHGPAITIDTACSSSLVSLHSACQSLRRGESTLALAGGVSIYCTPWFFTTNSVGLVNSDGRSKPYARAANGVGLCEGAGMLVLERLGDARRNGHPVLAIVRGSAVNSDGASNGLAAPNEFAQRKLIQAALDDAGLASHEVDAVDGHGTGTPVGDPIEVRAVMATYGQNRSPGQPLWLGSLKSNIGHAGAAAGVGSVIKMVQAIRHGTLPRTLNVDAPTEAVDWSVGGVELLTEARPWPRTGRPRRAAVSGFGISGTNAHVILESAEPLPERVRDGPDKADPPPGSLAMVVSAKSADALRAQAVNLRNHLRTHPWQHLVDVAHTLAHNRSLFEHRGAVVAADRGDFDAGLTALADGVDAPGVLRGTGRPDTKIAFIFPGHGAQWTGMAEELLASSSVFADAVARCDAAFADHLNWSVASALRGELDPDAAARVNMMQPQLFTVMVGLTELWRAHGVQPDAVLGHSQGEVVAAYVAGAIDLSDAARITARRSMAIHSLTGGAVASVLAPARDVRRRLERFGDRLDLALINGPSACAVSGLLDAIEEFVAECTEQGIRAVRVPGADSPGHTARVEPLRERMLRELTVAPASSDITFYSAVEAQRIDTVRLGADYWYAGARRTVRFEEATRALLADGYRLLIEVSSHPVLSVPMRETIEDAGLAAVVVPTLRRDDGGPDRFLTSVADAAVHGARPDWTASFSGTAVELPTYAFQRQRFWLRTLPSAGDVTEVGQRPVDHSMVSALVPVAGTDAVLCTGRVSLTTHSWLADHAGMGTVLLPGTAFVELALTAAEEFGYTAIDELVLAAPLILPEEGGVAIQVSVGESDDDGLRPVHIYGRQDSDTHWTEHASGRLARYGSAPEVDLSVWPPPGAEPIALGEFYARLNSGSAHFGPAFQGLRAVWRTGSELFGEVALPPAADGVYGVHPALLDAALHTSMVEVALADSAAETPLRLPFSWSGVRRYSTGAPILRVRIRRTSETEIGLDIADEHGTPVLSAHSMISRDASVKQLSAAAGLYDGLMAVHWTASGTTHTVHAQRWATLGAGEHDHADLAELTRALAAGAQFPDVVLAMLPSTDQSGDDDGPAAVHAHVARALGLVQDWLKADALADSRLVFVTRGAVAVDSGEAVPGLSQSGVWGLIRGAQAEHPDRFTLADIDHPEASARLVASVAASGEPQFAVRAGTVLVPRLTRMALTAAQRERPAFDADSVVLITGATGLLGPRIARHLVTAHDVRSLVLISRRGPAAPGAADLLTELTDLGARVELVACDAANLESVRTLFADHPISAVVHCAGLVDDGPVDALDASRLAEVLRPKVDAAAHLHRCSRERDLTAFVLFSSAAGLIGRLGQANYAAANSYLDALACHREALGAPSVSLAWGAWEAHGAIAGASLDAELLNMARYAVLPMPDCEALALFDAACRLAAPLMSPCRFDLAAVAGLGEIPQLMRGLVRSTANVTGSATGTAGALFRQEVASAENPGAVVLRHLQELVAVVLGLPGADSVDPTRPFLEAGMDSLTAMELRNRLSASIGKRLPPTAIFENPAPTMLTEYVLDLLNSPAGAPSGSTPSSALTPRGSVFTVMIKHAAEHGRLVEFFDSFAATAEFRPAFHTSPAAEGMCVPVNLARGASPVGLVCIPSVLAMSGPHEYARFAAALRGVRTTTVLPLPGYQQDELLPADLGALARLHADVLAGTPGPDRYVVLTHSSGAAVAHELARELERRGETPAALILLDPFTSLKMAFNDVPERLMSALAGDGGSVAMSDFRLTAMGGYTRLVTGWQAGALAAPTLLVRPNDPMPGAVGDTWRTTWQDEHTALDVPGNHFSMLEDHAHTTADAVHGWISDHVELKEVTA
jgi:polyketide synthase 7